MSWRSIGRTIAILLLVVAIISIGGWLVLLGYGEDEMAVYPLVIAGITFIIGSMLLSITVIRPNYPGVVEQRTVVRHVHPRMPITPPPRPPTSPAYPDFPVGGVRDLDPEQEAMMQRMMEGMSRGFMDSPPELTVVNEEAYYHETSYPADARIDKYGRVIEGMDEFTHDLDRARDKKRRIERRWNHK